MSAALARRPNPAHPRHPARRSPNGRAHEPDALDQYLRDISAYPLVSRDEEIGLARRVVEGDGDALDALVRANLRFVVAVAKTYQHHGVPLLDLIEEGNVGLIRAAHRFDPDQGVRFISYAVWWIRQSILQALAEQSRIVRVPLNRAGAVHRLGRRAAALEQELGREPTTAEIAAETGLTAEAVTRELSIARPHVSLDAPIAAGTDDALMDVLADDAAEAPDGPVLDGSLVDAVEASLATLAPRERKVLRLYFGFGEEPLTLEQIGARLGITRERVRQIKEKALGRLRKSGAATPLAQYR